MNTFSKLRQKCLTESVLMYASRSKQTEEKPNNPVDKKDTVLSTINTSAKTNTPQSFKLNDGSTIEITPMEAKNVIYAYEELNDSNQGIFESFLQQDITGYALMIDFANDYSK